MRTVCGSGADTQELHKWLPAASLADEHGGTRAFDAASWAAEVGSAGLARIRGALAVAS